jgi:hypothetical protein
MLNSLSITMQRVCRSLRTVTDKEYADEVKAASAEEGTEAESIMAKQPAEVVEEQQPVEKTLDVVKEKEVVPPVVGTPPATSPPPPPPALQRTQSLASENVQAAESNGDALATVDKQVVSQDPAAVRTFTSVAQANAAANQNRRLDRRRGTTEKTIGLDVLQQYFAGSLKDAAKSIGVCPTTLKRICRQHGISRWPSRKINKVSRSLKKLQGVIESVQGADGTLRINALSGDIASAAVAAAAVTGVAQAATKDTPPAKELSNIDSSSLIPIEEDTSPMSESPKDNSPKRAIPNGDHARNSDDESSGAGDGSTNHGGSAYDTVSLEQSEGRKQPIPPVVSLPNGSSSRSHCGSDWDRSPNGSISDFDRNTDSGSGTGFNGNAICVESRVHGGASALAALRDSDLSSYGNPGSANYEGLNEYSRYALEDSPREVTGAHRTGSSHHEGDSSSPSSGGANGSGHHRKHWPSVPVTEVGSVTVKATFGADTVRFKLPVGSGYLDLRNEVSRRLKVVDDQGFDLKYLDDEEEWMLITCDADIKECIDVAQTLGRHMVKLTVRQSNSQNSSGNTSNVSLQELNCQLT